MMPIKKCCVSEVSLKNEVSWIITSIKKNEQLDYGLVVLEGKAMPEPSVV